MYESPNPEAGLEPATAKLKTRTLVIQPHLTLYFNSEGRQLILYGLFINIKMTVVTNVKITVE